MAVLQSPACGLPFITELRWEEQEGPDAVCTEVCEYGWVIFSCARLVQTMRSPKLLPTPNFIQKLSQWEVARFEAVSCIWLVPFDIGKKGVRRIVGWSTSICFPNDRLTVTGIATP